MTQQQRTDFWIRPDLDVRHMCDETTRDVVGVAAQQRALAMIGRCPEYQPTPLHTLPALAASLGLDKLWVKEEGQRFSLQSFKALGGAFAVACAMRSRDPDAPPPMFCCASDGNHGRSVAFGARHFGGLATIFVHHGVSEPRIAAIRALGADVVVIRGTYDDSVAAAAEAARASGWQLIADTTDAEETQVRTIEAVANVMRGYTLIAAEACAAAGADQASDACPFTHVIVQAGVGGLAAALAGWFADRFGEGAPLLVVAEPTEAACLLASARAGQPTKIEGELETVMAMLSCGEPSAPAWQILSRHADAFVAVADAEAEEAVRLFAHPRRHDTALAVGESGAAGLAALLALSRDPALGESLRLDHNSSVLLIATEAPTDLDAWNKSLSGR